MSNPGISKLQTLSITGNPTFDAGIRYGLVIAGTAITGAIVGWLNAHGFHDPNLTMYVGGGVATVLMAAAAALWGIIKSSKNEQITQLREMVAMKAGIAAAEAPVPTPEVKTPADVKQILADHAPAILKS